MKIKTFKNTILTFTIAGILTIGAFPVDAALGDAVLKKGMQHDDIKLLQEELKNKGFFNNETTTYFGDITLNAVKSFQAAYGLSQDGIFGPGTYEVLKSLNESKVNEEVVDVAITPEVQTFGAVTLTYIRDLKLDVTGTDVNQLQECLKKLGYLVIENTTEYYGPQTMEAVSAFQKSYSITEDGIAGLHTIEILNDVMAGRRESIPAPTRGDINRSKASDLINTAKKYLGVRYAYGGSTASGFDCSGFTQFIYRQHGINIPRSTVDQAQVGTKLSKAELQVGDLIIFSNTYKSGPSHAAIYIGNDQFIHSSSVGSGGVVISDLNSAYYSGKFSYGRRVF